MIKEFLISGLPIIFVLTSLLLMLISRQKESSVTVSDDEHELIRYISVGSKLVLKRFILFSVASTLGFILFVLLANLFDPAPIQRFLMVILASITSIGIGWFGLRLSVSSIHQFLYYSNHSFPELRNIIQKKGTYILITIISLAILDLSFWFFILDLFISYDIANMAHFCADFFHIKWSDQLLLDPDFINRKHLFITIILSLYAVGSVLQVLLARLNLSLFSASFDATSDLIGFTEYDLTEDDLRNPGSIPDQIGDQLKGIYLTLSELFSTIIFIIISVAIIGGMVGVIEHSLHSILLIEFPLLLFSFGVLITLCTKKISRSFFTHVKKSVVIDFSEQLIISLSMIMFSGILVYVEFIPTHLFWALIIGLVSGIILYPLVSFFLGSNSRLIDFIKKNSEHSIIGTLSSGLFSGFLVTCAIAIFIACLSFTSFLLTGHDTHVVLDLYHIGIISIGLIIVSFPIFSDAVTYSISDNALGISDMLSLPKNQIRNLQQIQVNISTKFKFYKIVNLIAIFYASGVFLLPFMIRAMKWLSEFERMGLNTRHHIHVSDSNLFDVTYDITHFVLPFDIHFLNPIFILGLLLGFAILFGICSMVMVAVSKHSSSISELSHKELHQKPTIWNHSELPDYLMLVRHISKSASSHMIILFSISILSISIIWATIGVAGMIGFLISLTAGGIVLALFFLTTGSILSTAKKSLDSSKETIQSPAYISLFFSDKLGDLFKDVIAPIIISFVKFSVLFGILMVGIVLEIHEVFLAL